MSNDEQDVAESFDEDMIGTEGVLSEQATIDDFAPERPHGIQFADADVTDESFAERTAQEEPEVWERALPSTDDVVDPIEELEADPAEG